MKKPHDGANLPIRNSTAELQKNGYRVLRLLVEDVCTDLDAVLDAIQGVAI